MNAGVLPSTVGETKYQRLGRNKRRSWTTPGFLESYLRLGEILTSGHFWQKAAGRFQGRAFRPGGWEFGGRLEVSKISPKISTYIQSSGWRVPTIPSLWEWYFFRGEKQFCPLNFGEAKWLSLELRWGFRCLDFILVSMGPLVFSILCRREIILITGWRHCCNSVHGFVEFVTVTYKSGLKKFFQCERSLLFNSQKKLVVYVVFRALRRRLEGSFWKGDKVMSRHVLLESKIRIFCLLSKATFKKGTGGTVDRRNP